MNLLIASFNIEMLDKKNHWMEESHNPENNFISRGQYSNWIYFEKSENKYDYR